MDEFDPITPPHTPTAARPLLGLTILVVEDSRYTCDALRLLSLRSGARLRRADCIASAKRHLQVYRPSVVLVDVGLPDGSGLDLIAELAEQTPRIGVIIGISGEDARGPQALASGADDFFAKPIENIAQFQETILKHLPPERRPSGPRVLRTETVRPDPMSYADDLAHVAELIRPSAETPPIQYIARFVYGIAKSAHDRALEKAGVELSEALTEARPVAEPVARVAALVNERLNTRTAV